jgi:thiol:disulfide interchange protein
MKKLLRLFVLSLLFITLFAIAYAVLPTIVWVYGGEFKTISHNMAYVTFGSIAILILLGVQFYGIFDADFYERKQN